MFGVRNLLLSSPYRRSPCAGLRCWPPPCLWQSGWSLRSPALGPFEEALCKRTPSAAMRSSFRKPLSASLHGRNQLTNKGTNQQIFQQTNKYANESTNQRLFLKRSSDCIKVRSFIRKWAVEEGFY